MDDTSFIYWAEKIKKNKRASYKGLKAPHKPILLISILQLIDTGIVGENKIRVSAELVAKYKDNWNWLVKTDLFTPNFFLPFFHLSNDGFWNIKTFTGREIPMTRSNSVKSFKALSEAVEYGYFEEAFFALISRSDNRQLMYQFLLENYFPRHDSISERGDLFNSIENQILHDPPALYRKRIEVSDEAEIFVRSGVFKKIVPEIYDCTCAITGMKITGSFNVQMIDACHIIPFGETHDDTISNGISLSPNMHRAFDRGLIGIDQEYKVVVSQHFEGLLSNRNIHDFHGHEILLPSNDDFLPDLKGLAWHMEHRFKAG